MITATAPGSLMICGEHSVVYGEQAIVCAIAQRVSVKLIGREDKQVMINSALAQYEAPLNALTEEPKLRFVLEALRRHLPKQGVEITIESEIDPLLGFGSSAAVSVAMIAALSTFNQQALNHIALHRATHDVILAVQKRGSGADIAASIWGGMIQYTPPPALAVQTLPLPDLALSVRYAGYKTPTAEVLAKIATAAQSAPEFYAQLYQQMGQVSICASQAASKRDWSEFYYQLSQYQIFMEKLGVCDAVQAEHIAAALAQSAATKISGSGLGDCIIAFAMQPPTAHQAVQIEEKGVQVIKE